MRSIHELSTMAVPKDPKLLRRLGARIAQIRDDKNLTNEKIHADTGVNMSRLIKGQQDTSVSTLKKLADYFEMPMAEFIKGVEE